MRSILKEIGLPNGGTKAAMVDRHKRLALLEAASRDREVPVSRRELIRQVASWEVSDWRYSKMELVLDSLYGNTYARERKNTKDACVCVCEREKEDERKVTSRSSLLGGDSGTYFFAVAMGISLGRQTEPRMLGVVHVCLVRFRFADRSCGLRSRKAE